VIEKPLQERHQKPLQVLGEVTVDDADEMVTKMGTMCGRRTTVLNGMSSHRYPRRWRMKYRMSCPGAGGRSEKNLRNLRMC